MDQHFSFGHMKDRLSSKRREKKLQKQHARELKEQETRKLHDARERKKQKPAASTNQPLPSWIGPSSSGSGGKAHTLLGLKAKTPRPPHPRVPKNELNPFIETSHPLHVARSRVHTPERAANMAGRSFLDMSPDRPDYAHVVAASTRPRTAALPKGMVSHTASGGAPRPAIGPKEFRQSRASGSDPRPAIVPKEVRQTRAPRVQKVVADVPVNKDCFGRVPAAPVASSGQVPWDHGVDIDDLLHWYESWGTGGAIGLM